VKREIKEGKESMWLPRSWVQIIPPCPLYLLYNYGIGLGLFYIIVGQIQLQYRLVTQPPILRIDFKAMKMPQLLLKGEIEMKLKVDRT
jgi:hypothetical protein